MTTDTLWDHGYGSKRHIVDPDRPDGNQRIGRAFLAICSAGPTSPARVALDSFSDDHTPNIFGWSPKERRLRTHAETVMRFKPCLRCCKVAGIDPAAASEGRPS